MIAAGCFHFLLAGGGGFLGRQDAAFHFFPFALFFVG